MGTRVHDDDPEEQRRQRRDHEGTRADEGAGDHAGERAEEDDAQRHGVRHGGCDGRRLVAGRRLDGRGHLTQQAFDDALRLAPRDDGVAREQQPVREHAHGKPGDVVRDDVGPRPPGLPTPGRPS